MLFKETYQAIIDLFDDTTCRGAPVNVSMAYGDKMTDPFEPNSETDVYRPEILVIFSPPEPDTSKDHTEKFNFMDSSTGTTIMTVDYPQAIKFNVQFELKSLFEHDIIELQEQFLSTIGFGRDIGITWTIGGYDVTMQCHLQYISVSDQSLKFANEYYGRVIYIYSLESWLWQDAEPATEPLITQRIMRVANVQNTDILDEVVNFDE